MYQWLIDLFESKGYEVELVRPTGQGDFSSIDTQDGKGRPITIHSDDGEFIVAKAGSEWGDHEAKLLTVRELPTADELVDLLG